MPSNNYKYNVLLTYSQHFFKVFLILFAILLASADNYVQGQRFNFQYNGPDTIFVNSDCVGVLQWGHPANPEISSNIPGVFIQSSTFTISGGYSIGSNVTAGETVNVTYRVTDTQGQTGSFTFSIQFVDTIAPQFDFSNLPAEITIRCGENPMLSFDQVSDNCTSFTDLIIVTEDDGLIDFCNGGQVNRTFRVTDQWGNSNSFVQVLWVESDQTVPVLVQPPMDLTIVCDQFNADTVFEQWVANRGGMEVSDNCTELFWTISPAVPDLTMACMVPQSISFIASDGCGNSVSASANLSLEDTIPPVLIRNAQRLIHFCDGTDIEALFERWLDRFADADLSDNCTPEDKLFSHYRKQGVVKSKEDLMMEFRESVSDGCENNLLFGGVMYDRVLAWAIIEFIFEDYCNNQVGTQASFAVIDTVPPVWVNLPGDLELDCGDQSAMEQSIEEWYNTNMGAVAEDNCGFAYIVPNPALEDAILQFRASQELSCGRSGQLNVRLELLDICGNKSADVIDVRFTVIDSTAPVLIDTPTDTIMNCSSLLAAEINTRIDNLSGAKFTDDCGEVLPFYFVWEDSNNRIDTVEFGDYDNYPFPMETNCTWELMLKFIVADECGNESSTQAKIELIDNEAPVFVNFPANITVECDAIPEPIEPVVHDNCVFNLALQLLETSNQSADPQLCGYYTYSIQRRWTATDACGNSTQAIQTIQVVDSRAPNINLPPINTISCDADTSVRIEEVRLLITDNCATDPVFSYQQFVFPGTCIGEYRIERQWQARDYCNNISSLVQQFFVRDTEAPRFVVNPSDLTISCDSRAELSNQFEVWLEQRAGAVVTDNCSAVVSFAAVPGSYTLSNRNTWPGQQPVLQEGSCANSPNFLVQTVDFVFSDNCGNAVVRNTRFTVDDEEAPQFVNCPTELTFSADPGLCASAIILDALPVFDLCTGAFETVILQDTKAIFSNSPGNLDVIVNPVQFNFNYPLPLGASVNNARIVLSLINVDGEGAGEFFNVLSEDNRILGRSASTIVQCGNSSININLNTADLNNWIADGILSFRLEANVPIGQQGRFSINDICPGAQVSLRLEFDITENSSIVRTWSLDGSPRQDLNINTGIHLQLPVGEYIFTQYATDCFGNEGSCMYSLQIVDNEMPIIICPDDLTIVLDPAICEIPVFLPAYLGTIDNCGFAGESETRTPMNEQDSWISFAFDPDLKGFLAEDKQLVFENMIGNAETDPVMLTIELMGDIADSGAYFTIFDEDNNALGTTESGQPNVIAGGCAQISVVQFLVTAADFNRWAADGRVIFLAKSNTDFTIPPGGSDSGINPCFPVRVNQDGDVDSSSFIRAKLNYGYSPVWYHVSGATDLSRTQIVAPDLSPEVILKSGTNRVDYITIDKSGNEGSCFFNIFVADVESPVARCQNAILYVNPSGLINYELMPQEIDGGSSDNCEIVNYDLNPRIFTCEDVGREFTITLTVSDAAGASSSCTAIARVESFNLIPGFDLDVCKPDTLRLFGNVPPGPPGNVYTYRWTGPNGFLSFEPNPIIISPGQANSGTYTLEVRGTQNCGAIGSITISVPEQLGVPDLVYADGQVCQGESVFMETQLFSGNVVYQWYRGTPPGGVLVAETTAPAFSTTLPPGNYLFYVIVKSNNCSSVPSVARQVRVQQQVIAEVDQDYLELCEGELLRLSTSQSGPGYTYRWIGPNGFDQTNRDIVVSNSVDFIHAGRYTLFIFDQGCPSTAAEAEVFVKARPKQPEIFYDPVFCPGQTVLFSINNIPVADAYRWILPNNATFTTLQNQFIIGQASDQQNGLWRVFVIQDGCESALSDPILVDIEELYNIQINNPGPRCEGDTVHLSVDPLPGATYRWYNNEGQLGSDASVFIPANSGVVNLEVITAKQCRYEVSTQVQTFALPTITAMSSDAVECMDGSRPVCFGVTVFPPDPGNYQYVWNGPSFTSNVANPCIPAAGAAINGVYTLQIINNQGCRSPERTLQLDIRDIPERPAIEREVSYCEGDELLLRVKDYGSNAQYFWSTPTGLQVVNGSPLLRIPIAEVARHSGQYSVRVQLNGCLSEESAFEQIVISPIPSRPVIDAFGSVCEGDTLHLRTNAVAGANYFWQGPNNFSGIGNEVFIFPVNIQNTGNYSVRIMVNGCSSDPSVPFFIQVNPKPSVPAISTSLDVFCADSPGALLQLCISEGDVIPGARYTWFEAISGDPLGNSVASRCLNITQFDRFVNGINEFYVVVSFNGCVSGPSLPIAVRIDKIPAEFADAGQDQIACGNDFAVLNALPTSLSSGQWSVFLGNGIFERVNQPDTEVSNLRAGDNLYIWSLSYLSCTNFDRDTVAVFYQTTPVPRDDQATVPFASEISIQVLNNDNLPAAYTIDVVVNPSHGMLSPRADGSFSFIANPNYVGVDQFVYEVCATGCPGLCGRATVFLQIGDDSVCDAPNIITPNGDGTNDVFFIPCLSSDLFPNNKVSIYNEYGGVIFEESPYSNNWQGTYKGQDVPVGTYFYVIDFGEGRPVSKGFLIIKR
jgi:gliding motility-associated-like protein